MNTRLIIPLLVAGALAFACGPRPRSDAPAALASATPAHAAAPALTSEHRRADPAKRGTKIDSRLNVAVAPTGVTLALNVANVGTKHVELTFPSGQSYDFVVLDSIGREVWHWSRGRMFTQSVQNKQLGSGESMQVAEHWKSHARPGKYTAVATLNSTNYPVEERLDFVVP